MPYPLHPDVVDNLDRGLVVIAIQERATPKAADLAADLQEPGIGKLGACRGEARRVDHVGDVLETVARPCLQAERQLGRPV